jgi:hypothetical protein
LTSVYAPKKIARLGNRGGFLLRASIVARCWHDAAGGQRGFHLKDRKSAIWVACVIENGACYVLQLPHESFKPHA